MVGRYFDGVLPSSEADGPAEKALGDALASTVERAEDAIDRLAIHEAITAVSDFVGAVNVYVTEQEPWKVAKDDTDEGRGRLAAILYTAAESLRAIAVLHAPVMPKTSAALWESLGADAIGPLYEQHIQDAGRWGQLPAGVTLTKGDALFPRLADDET
jgi:methionyl-tRNA synthetase